LYVSGDGDDGSVLVEGTVVVVAEELMEGVFKHLVVRPFCGGWRRLVLGFAVCVGEGYAKLDPGKDVGEDLLITDDARNGRVGLSRLEGKLGEHLLAEKDVLCYLELLLPVSLLLLLLLHVGQLGETTTGRHQVYPVGDRTDKHLKIS
jgi:hypothetical protein